MSISQHSVGRFCLVNCAKKPKLRSSNIDPIKSEDGQIITDAKMLTNEWKTYLEGLATPKEKPEYDKDFKDRIG